MLSVIREGLEEAIEEEKMDWEMKNSLAVTNTDQLLDAGRAFANFQKFEMNWDCEFPAWMEVEISDKKMATEKTLKKNAEAKLALAAALDVAKEKALLEAKLARTQKALEKARRGKAPKPASEKPPARGRKREHEILENFGEFCTMRKMP
jgi:hypothetical protein